MTVNLGHWEQGEIRGNGDLRVISELYSFQSNVLNQKGIALQPQSWEKDGKRGTVAFSTQHSFRSIGTLSPSLSPSCASIVASVAPSQFKSQSEHGISASQDHNSGIGFPLSPECRD